MSASPLLVLITKNYPYEYNGGEVPFIHPEIPCLEREFEKILLAPLNPFGNMIPIPQSVSVTKALSNRLRSPKRNRLLTTVQGMKSFLAEAPAALRAGQQSALRRAYSWALISEVAVQWAAEEFPTGQPLLFYTYWRTGVTLGLLYAARKKGNSVIVTRVHRHDLYHHRQEPPYQPYAPQMYTMLDKTFAISEHGRNYIRSLGVEDWKTDVARLGTQDPGFVCSASSDNMLRIVSCSFVNDVKRVPLLAAGIARYAELHPSKAVSWTHIGDGERMTDVKKALRYQPGNLTTRLMGRLDNQEVMNFYRKTPCDLFLQVSRSEGLPFAMQEAAAVGLPIITTNVGGVGEIVSEKNGRLLPPNLTAKEISEAISWFSTLAPSQIAKLRAGSRAIWEEYFNAEGNHRQFAANLKLVWKEATT